MYPNFQCCGFSFFPHHSLDFFLCFFKPFLQFWPDVYGRLQSAFPRRSLLLPCGSDQIRKAPLLPEVSSMIRSTPVSVSRVRILRPSRPMILPFISSLGSCTTEIVASATWSAAHFCIAFYNIFLCLFVCVFFCLAYQFFVKFGGVNFHFIFKQFSTNNLLLVREVRPEILSSS